MMESDAFDGKNFSSKPHRHSYAISSFMFAHAPVSEFTKSKEFVLRVVEKVPLVYIDVESELVYDPDVVLTFLNSDRSFVHDMTDLLVDQGINLEDHFLAIKKQVDGFEVFQETFVPHVRQSKLNQGETTTVNLLGCISDFIGLPSKENVTKYKTAEASYESLGPYLMHFKLNAPLKPSNDLFSNQLQLNHIFGSWRPRDSVASAPSQSPRPSPTQTSRSIQTKIRFVSTSVVLSIQATIASTRIVM